MVTYLFLIRTALRILFAISLLINVSLQVPCFQGGGTGTYPMGTGGSADKIEYLAIDMDNQLNIVVGGKCKDSGLCGDNTEKPIIEYIQSTASPPTFVWQKYLTMSNIVEVRALKFKPDGTEFVAVFDFHSTAKLWIATFTSSTGAGLCAFKYSSPSSSATVYAQGLYFTGASSIIIGMEIDDKWSTFRFPASSCVSASSDLFYKSVSTTTNGRAYSIVVDSSETSLYTTGKLTTATPEKHSQLYSKISLSTGSLNWVFYRITSNERNIRYSSLITYSSVEYIWSCGYSDDNDHALYNRLKVGATTPIASDFLSAYQHQDLRCRGIRGITDFIAYAFVEDNTGTNQFYMVKVTLGASSSTVYAYYIENFLKYSNTNVNYAAFTSSSTPFIYITGKTDQIPTTTKTKEAGLILKMTTTEGPYTTDTCDQFTVLYDTATNLVETSYTDGASSNIVISTSYTQIQSISAQSFTVQTFPTVTPLNIATGGLSRWTCPASGTSGAFTYSATQTALVDQTYDMAFSTGTTQYIFSDFSVGACTTSITYLTSSLPAGVTFDSTLKKFTWPVTSVMSTTITVTGTITASSQTITDTFSISVTDSCLPFTSYADQTAKYQIMTDSIVTVQLGAFSVGNPSCLITYSLVDSSNVLITDLAFNFNSGTYQLNIGPITDNTKAKSVVYKIKGQITGRPTAFVYTSLTIDIVAGVVLNVNSGPPLFDPVLENQEVLLNQTKSYAFPKMIDNDIGDSAYVLSWNLGQATTFVTFKNGTSPTININPVSNPSQVGTFTIKVTLADTNAKMKSATYSFTITVPPPPTVETPAANQTQTNSTSIVSSISVSINPVSPPRRAPQKIPIGKKIIPLEASIQSIDYSGEVTVIFNKPIYKVANISSIDIKVLEIYVKPGPDSEIMDLNITSWKSKDTLIIRILDIEFFQDQETGQPIKPKTQLKRVIPKQLASDSATAMLQGSKATTKSTMSSLMYGNLALNIVMAASLQLLWGMINVMQIIVHMPMLNVAFPQNAILFYNFIIDISNFDIIPTGWIKEQIFSFKNQKKPSSQFSSMGFESDNIIDNLGSMVLYLVGFVMLVIFVFVIRFLKQKHQLINRLYNHLFDLIFFNMILRVFLEGYIQYAISSLMNIHDLSWEGASDTFSSIFAIIVFVCVFFFPFVVWILLWKKYEVLDTELAVKRFGSTYLELRIKSRPALLYNVFYMLRRLLFAVLAIMFDESPYVQVQLMVFHCLLMIVFITLAQPFENPLLNRLEIFNEACIIGAAYHLILFTDYIDDPLLQYKAGWSIIGVTTLNIVVNMFIMGRASLKLLKLKLIKYKLRINAFIAKRNKARLEQKYFELNNGNQIQIKKRNLPENLQIENLESHNDVVNKRQSILPLFERQNMTRSRITSDIMQDNNEIHETRKKNHLIEMQKEFKDNTLYQYSPSRITKSKTVRPPDNFLQQNVAESIFQSSQESSSRFTQELSPHMQRIMNIFSEKQQDQIVIQQPILQSQNITKISKDHASLKKRLSIYSNPSRYRPQNKPKLEPINQQQPNRPPLPSLYFEENEYDFNISDNRPNKKRHQSFINQR